MSFVLLIDAREIGAFSNRPSKSTCFCYSYKFNNILMSPLFRILLCLAFYIVIFIKALKNYTSSILKVSITSLHLLISYSILTQLWIYCHCKSRPKAVSVSQWNLNSITSHNFSKI